MATLVPAPFVFVIALLCLTVAAYAQPPASSADSIAEGAVGEGLGDVNVFATSADFPLLQHTQCIAVDKAGRLWAGTTWPGHDNDFILQIDDLDNDGAADKVRTFAHSLDGIHQLQPDQDGIIVQSRSSKLRRVVDLDGDGRSYDTIEKDVVAEPPNHRLTIEGQQVFAGTHPLVKFPGTVVQRATLGEHAAWVLERRQSGKDIRIYRVALQPERLAKALTDTLKSPPATTTPADADGIKPESTAQTAAASPGTPKPSQATPAPIPTGPTEPKTVQTHGLPETLHQSLTTPGGRSDSRTKALRELAETTGQTPTWVLSRLALRTDSAEMIEIYTTLLRDQPVDDIRALEADWLALARGRHRGPKAAPLRSLAFAGLLHCNPRSTWKLAASRIDFLQALLDALVTAPTERLPPHREALVSLLQRPPPCIRADRTKRIAGSRIRITKTTDGPLHLAEVQVFSGGKNIGPNGKARQSSTADDAEASRAIDGKTSGNFLAGSITATEPGADAWWELGFTRDVLIESITIWNRSDRAWNHLNDYTIEIANRAGTIVYRTSGHPTPRSSATHPMAGGLANQAEHTTIQILSKLEKPGSPVLMAFLNLLAKGRHIPETTQAFADLKLDGMNLSSLNELDRRIQGISARLGKAHSKEAAVLRAKVDQLKSIAPRR